MGARPRVPWLTAQAQQGGLKTGVRRVRIRPDDEGTFSIAQAYELNYWCKRFGPSPELLAEAMAEVGDRLADLQRFFRKGPVRR